MKNKIILQLLILIGAITIFFTLIAPLVLKNSENIVSLFLVFGTTTGLVSAFLVSKNLKKYTTSSKNYKDLFPIIDTKLKTFIHHPNLFKKSINLDEVKLIIDNLSNIYQFKKDVELGNMDKDEIINCLIKVLKNQFFQNDILIVETNLSKNSKTIIKKIGKATFCKLNNTSAPYLKLNMSIDNNTKFSTTNEYICNSETQKFYYSTSRKIDTDIYIEIFLAEEKNNEKILKFIKNVPFINTYFTEIIPSLKISILLEKFKELAFQDQLTGLYNRKFLSEYVMKILPQAARENKKFAVLIGDVDYFKSINDTYGHNVGDIVLKEISSVLSKNIRDSDLLARWGGEEFIIILNNIHDAEDALVVAEKIRTQVEQTNIAINGEGYVLNKTISIGLSTFPNDGTTFEELCITSDLALYKAKNSGRNKVIVFDKDKNKKVSLAVDNSIIDSIKQIIDRHTQGSTIDRYLNFYEELKKLKDINKVYEELRYWFESVLEIDLVEITIYSNEKKDKKIVFQNNTQNSQANQAFLKNYIINMHHGLLVNFCLDYKTQNKLDDIDDENEHIETFFYMISLLISSISYKDMIEKLSFRDPLTNTYNRKFLIEHLKKLLPLANKENKNISFLLAGIDRFKAISDEFNYDIADKVLVNLSKVLRQCIRDSDLLIRLDGDEFLVALIGIKEQLDAFEIANTIVDTFAQTEVIVNAQQHVLKKTVCVGITHYDHKSDIDTIFKNADISLQEAKNMGRGKIKEYVGQKEEEIELF